MKENTINSETIFAGCVFTIRKDIIETDNGYRAEREIVLHPGGVGVLAVNDRNEVILVKQYRYAAGREMLEIPAGRLEKDEDPSEAGKRELAEETGYSAESFVSLGYVIPTGGYCNEKIYLYAASELTAGTCSPDEGEFVDTVVRPMNKVVEAIANGSINDGKTIAAVCRYMIGGNGKWKT